MRSNAAGAMSSTRSTCAPPTTAARTASKPTSSCAGWRCYCCASPTETADTWRNLRNELDRIHLVTLATNEGTVAQRTELTPGQRRILGALSLPEPPRFYDFTPAAD